MAQEGNVVKKQNKKTPRQTCDKWLLWTHIRCFLHLAFIAKIFSLYDFLIWIGHLCFCVIKFKLFLLYSWLSQTGSRLQLAQNAAASL